MTPASVAHLALPPQCDLLALYDYRTLNLDNSLEELPWSSYDEITVIAWSLGVWTAEQVIPKWWRDSLCDSTHLAQLRLIAVAGSPYPMHDLWGIPRQTFEGTLAGLTEENRQRFNRRMCGGKRYEPLYEILSKRPTEELRAELQAVYESLLDERLSVTTPQSNLKWHLAIIGERDLIFPAKHLTALWQALEVPMILLADGYHYLFDQWQSWDQLWADIK